MDKIEEAQKILKKYNQDHIKVSNEDIANQVLKINFEQLQELYDQINTEIVIEDIKPVKAIRPEKMDKEELQKCIEIGEKTIKQNKFAVTVMAGGQGTRLGHYGPKGTFKVKINNKEKYLFEIIIDKLIDANKKYNVIIPCYIMTSPENNEETVRFFNQMNYFGYPKDYINFFVQEEMPLIDEDGKLLRGEDGKIKLASNGNGGIFYSMKKNNIIKDMKNKGIEWIFIGSVDNLLVKYVDTLLLGLTIQEKTKIGTRTIIKNHPYEKVGVLCKKNNKIKIVEYSELSKEMVDTLDENGDLLFGESHIMCNLFNIKALEKASTNKLKYHIAHKKTNYLDEENRLIIPKKPNCYKFEKFIFDSFGLFDNITILRGKREEDFAPIKNAEGIDSPETAINLYEEYISKKV